MPELSLLGVLILLLYAFLVGFGWSAGCWLWGKIGK
jgi:hypothetical protein